MLNQEEIFKKVANGTLDKMEALEMLKALNTSQEPEVLEPVQKDIDIDRIKEVIKEITCDILHLEKDAMDEDSTFNELGVDSIGGIEIVRDINKEFSINLDSVVLYDYATIEELANHIAGFVSKEEAKSATSYSEQYEKESGLDEIYHDKHYKELRGDFVSKLTSEGSNVKHEKARIKLNSTEKKNQ